MAPVRFNWPDFVRSLSPLIHGASTAAFLRLASGPRHRPGPRGPGLAGIFAARHVASYR